MKKQILIIPIIIFLVFACKKNDTLIENNEVSNNENTDPSSVRLKKRTDAYFQNNSMKLHLFEYNNQNNLEYYFYDVREPYQGSITQFIYNDNSLIKSFVKNDNFLDTTYYYLPDSIVRILFDLYPNREAVYYQNDKIIKSIYWEKDTLNDNEEFYDIREYSWNNESSINIKWMKVGCEICDDTFINYYTKTFSDSILNPYFNLPLNFMGNLGNKYLELSPNEELDLIEYKYYYPIKYIINESYSIDYEYDITF